jgi:hypothetical protein
MTKGLTPLVLVGVLACMSCALRTATEPAAAPTGHPHAAPEKPKSPPPAAPEKPAAAPAVVPRTEPANVRTAPAAATPVTPTEKATVNVPQPPAGNKTTGEAPPATASAYVYSPQQAATATHPATAPQAKAPGATTNVGPVNPDPVNPAPVAPAPTNAPGDTTPPPTTRGEVQLAVVPLPAVIAAGGIVTVDVMASSDTAVLDAPLHLSFDPNVMAYVDGAPGDFLTQGGSSVVFLADGSTRPGDVAVAAGRVERSQGATGSGLLCRVRLRGVAAGTTQVMVGQAKAWGVHGEELTVLPGGSAVSVR